MDWQQRIKIDEEKNRRSMMPIVYVLIVAALLLGLCLGVYFGIFAGRIIFVGGV